MQLIGFAVHSLWNLVQSTSNHATMEVNISLTIPHEGPVNMEDGWLS